MSSTKYRLFCSAPHIWASDVVILKFQKLIATQENTNYIKAYRYLVHGNGRNTYIFQRAVAPRWREKSTIYQFRNGNTSYFYKFEKCHRRRCNGHGPVPLNNEQRLKFVMSTYTRAAHHCDQGWTWVLTALRDSHFEPNIQQFQLRQLSHRLTRFHGIVEFYIFIHYIEETKPGHQQFHSISHHEWLTSLNLKLNSKHFWMHAGVCSAHQI